LWQIMRRPFSDVLTTLFLLDKKVDEKGWLKRLMKRGFRDPSDNDLPTSVKTKPGGLDLSWHNLKLDTRSEQIQKWHFNSWEIFNSFKANIFTTEKCLTNSKMMSWHYRCPKVLILETLLISIHDSNNLKNNISKV
jgi:hypothetical protein